MANCKHEAKDLPILYGEGKRPSVVVAHDKLQKTLSTEGQVFNAYSPVADATYRFPTLDAAIVKKQPVQEGSKAMQYLVDCEKSLDNGKTWTPDWFSLNHLAKRDANNEPVHKTWYALGNMYNRLVALCKLGEMKVGDAFEVSQVIFESGKPVRIEERDEDGQPKLDADGRPIFKNATRMRPCYTLPDAPAI